MENLRKRDPRKEKDIEKKMGSMEAKQKTQLNMRSKNFTLKHPIEKYPWKKLETLQPEEIMGQNLELSGYDFEEDFDHAVEYDEFSKSYQERVPLESPDEKN